MDTSIQTKPTVLIIDDSEDLLDVLQLILTKYGYNVLAQTGPNNIGDFVQRVKIDLLLLDVRLPNVSGRFVCKELKSNPITNYFPIVLMSASAKYGNSYKDCGADDFIEKPFNLTELITKVSTQVNASLHN
jgi:adenylate cyclase